MLGASAGYVKFGMDPQEAALRAYHRPGGSDKHWGDDDPAAYGLLGTDGDADPVPTDPGAYPAFYAGIATSLADHTPPPVDPRDAVATLAVLEAARASAATASVVRLP